LEITEVRIKVVNDGVLKAYASITIDAAFTVHHIRLIHHNNRYIISMPSHQIKQGTYVDYCHPINTDCRKKIEKAIITAYEKVVKERDIQQEVPK
jgi:stage V sporulation protein G